jgi:hypothetical protein
VYFPRGAGYQPAGQGAIAPHQIGLIDGRLFCARDPQALDRIVDLLNKEPKTRGTIADVMRVPLDDSIVWASSAADVCGLAIGVDGLVVLHRDRLEGLSLDGRSRWTVPLPAPPLRWGIALARDCCVVTLSDGQVLCFADSRP